MKCNECREVFEENEEVFLNKDTSDTGIYCEKHKPKDSFPTSQKKAAVTIGRRLGGGSIQEESPQKEEVEEKKEDEIIDVEPVVIKETPNVNIKDINFEVVKQTKPNIDFNYLIVKDQLEKSLEKYKGLIVTKENLASVKDDKSDLSALRTKINRFRIDEKKILLKPITEMEANLKVLVAIIEDVEKPIKEGIQVFDDATKAEKLVKVEGWLQKAYDNIELTEEFRTVIVEHNTKKKDVLALVDIQHEKQLEKANEDRVAVETKEDNISWIRQTVEQQENMHKVELNRQKYLDKFDNGVDPKQIVNDIIQDAQDIIKNKEIAVKEVTIEKPFIEVPDSVKDQDTEEKEETTVDIETGEILEDKFRFVIKVEETIENIILLKAFLVDNHMNYDLVGDVEKIETEEEK